MTLQLFCFVSAKIYIYYREISLYVSGHIAVYINWHTGKQPVPICLHKYRIQILGIIFGKRDLVNSNVVIRLEVKIPFEII